MTNGHRRTLSRFHVLAGIAAAVVALFLVGVLMAVNTLAGQVEDARAERDSLVNQVESLGADPVVSAEPNEPGPPGEPGEPGPPPSDEQVAVAVAAYCDENGDCRGGRGEPGEAGQDVTPSQVATAVTAYCNANGKCRGSDGEPGADSDVPGPQGERGPGPTAEQVADAVAAYCDDGRCRGQDGTDGADGETGPAGRGIQRTECVPDGPLTAHWEITYTDGETDNDAGPC